MIDTGTDTAHARRIVVSHFYRPPSIFVPGAAAPLPGPPMSSRRRPQNEVREVIDRVASEGAEPLADLLDYAAVTLGFVVTRRTLIRWICEGKRGVFLDGLRRPGAGWYSSRAAVDRFAAALADGTRPDA